MLTPHFYGTALVVILWIVLPTPLLKVNLHCSCCLNNYVSYINCTVFSFLCYCSCFIYIVVFVCCSIVHVVISPSLLWFCFYFCGPLPLLYVYLGSTLIGYFNLLYDPFLSWIKSVQFNSIQCTDIKSHMAHTRIHH